MDISGASPSAASPMRLSWATADIDRARAFFVDALGMREQWSKPADEHGAALLMVGFAGSRWHLELIADPDPALVDRLIAAGGRLRSGNDYWSQWGVSLDDPDGRRIVLSQRDWPID